VAREKVSRRDTAMISWGSAFGQERTGATISPRPGYWSSYTDPAKAEALHIKVLPEHTQYKSICGPVGPS